MEAILSTLTNADGSCELKSNISLVLCGVMGPGDVSSSKRLFDRTNIFLSINRLKQRSKEELASTVRPSVSKSAPLTASFVHNSDRFIFSIVKASIDEFAYPRTCIEICTQELKADGPTDTLHLNSICLALLDSGIRMHYVFASITIAIREIDGELLINPDQLQSNRSKAILTFVFKPSVILKGKLIGIHSNALKLAEQSSLELFDFYRQKMQQKFIYHIKTTL
ncbi:RNase_PH domain-containing protein [Meloidogyne graminicola]|uniref:RNase_PH domain-containing protein n=1 Tax=Meloidogyne graminicola TaxID=189291 RepID=A0A8S9ZIL7_9BILA|nr:RNase_PH domain-containing protein [Meloidogyne graminicola]